MRKRQRPIRVLVAKPGLDGHDVGAKLVARALADAGMEVIYTGLRQSPQMIARAALQEAVDVVGLSILSGAHVPLVKKISAALDEVGVDPLLMIGGCIPDGDRAALAELGIKGIFPNGSAFADIVDFLEENVRHEQ